MNNLSAVIIGARFSHSFSHACMRLHYQQMHDPVSSSFQSSMLQGAAYTELIPPRHQHYGHHQFGCSHHLYIVTSALGGTAILYSHKPCLYVVCPASGKQHADVSALHSKYIRNVHSSVPVENSGANCKSRNIHSTINIAAMHGQRSKSHGLLQHYCIMNIC